MEEIKGESALKFIFDGLDPINYLSEYPALQYSTVFYKIMHIKCS